MQLYIIYFYKILLWTGLALLSGCASLNDGKLLHENTVTIDRIDSSMATIGYVTVFQHSTYSYVHGNIRRRLSGRGSIPGHLDIELYNAAGKIVYTGTSDYRRKNNKTRYSDFLFTMNNNIESGSRLRIKHHNVLASKG